MIPNILVYGLTSYCTLTVSRYPSLGLTIIIALTPALHVALLNALPVSVLACISEKTITYSQYIVSSPCCASQQPTVT